MTVRTAFTHNTSVIEQSMVQNLVTEAIQVAGFDVKYLPRTRNNVDTLFDDAESSSFNTAYTIEMYFGQDTINGFKGLVEGEYDNIPETAFYMVGTISEATEKSKKMKD